MDAGPQLTCSTAVCRHWHDAAVRNVDRGWCVPYGQQNIFWLQSFTRIHSSQVVTQLMTPPLQRMSSTQSYSSLLTPSFSTESLLPPLSCAFSSSHSFSSHPPSSVPSPLTLFPPKPTLFSPKSAHSVTVFLH